MLLIKSFTFRANVLSGIGWFLPLLLFIYWGRKSLSGMGGMGAMGRPGQKGGSGVGGIFGFGQSTARIIKENTGVTFK